MRLRIPRHLGYLVLPGVLAGAACNTSDTAPSSDTLAVIPPKEPVALVGAWIRLTPKRLAGDTLILRADKSASGIIPWEDSRDLRVTTWDVRFGSRDSVAAREDWREGHTDGGDPECYMQKNPIGCISLPVLCIGVHKMRSCHTFAFFTRDTLVWSDRSRFVRLHEVSLAGVRSGAPVPD